MTAILTIEATGVRVAIPDSGIVLGRGPNERGGTFHPVDHRAASRYHCRISRADDGWRIEDLDSANGTFVDEAAAMPMLPLRTGSVLRLGHGAVVALVARFDDDTPVAQKDGGRVARIEGERNAAVAELEDLKRQLDTARADATELRARLDQAQTIRSVAEEREVQARARERDARVEADTNWSELAIAREQLAEAVAARADLTNELVGAREKIVLNETRENDTMRMLRLELRSRVDHAQQIETELSRRNARVGELEVALRSAEDNRDRALSEVQSLAARLEELERVAQVQSNLLLERAPVAKP